MGRLGRFTHLWVHDDEYVRLETDGGVLTAANHPFWNDTDKRWERSDELNVGDDVLTADGRRVRVGHLRSAAGHGAAYNLTVEGLHIPCTRRTRRRPGSQYVSARRTSRAVASWTGSTESCQHGHRACGVVGFRGWACWLFGCTVCSHCASRSRSIHRNQWVSARIDSGYRVSGACACAFR
jgi:hypothetical protein